MERGDDYDLWQRGVSSVGRPTWCFQLLLCLTALLFCCEEEEDDETRRGAVSGRNGSGGLSEGGSQAQHLRRRMILGF